MAATESLMLPLGTKAPSFTLLEPLTNKLYALNEQSIDKGLVIMFICNHCPYVIHLNKAIVELAREYQTDGINFIAISSNDAKTYPQDGPDKMATHALENQYPFPYLHDETQETAKAYKAACTPDFYLFDHSMSLVYRGQFDASRPGNNVPVTGNELRHAINCLLSNAPNNQLQKPSLGCNIKWKH